MNTLRKCITLQIFFYWGLRQECCGAPGVSFMSVLSVAHMPEMSSASCMEMCLLFIIMAVSYILGETPSMCFSVTAALVKANWFLSC